MGMYMCASKRERMGYHKQVSLHKISWSIESRPRAFIKAKSTLVSGSTTGVPFLLHSALTISALNMLEKRMLTIYSKHSRNTMKYPATGTAHVTSGSPYNGTTATALFASPCQGTAKRLASISITPNQPNHNTNLIPVHHAHMARNNNSVTVPTHCPH